MLKNFNNQSTIRHRHIPKGPPSYVRSHYGCLLPRQYYNCYSFALDIPSHGFGTPGLLHLNISQRFEMASRGEIFIIFENKTLLHDNLLKDGLIATEEGNYDSKQDHVICALFHKNGWHFYRLDDDGGWSHKVGEASAEKLSSGEHPADHSRRHNWEYVGLYKVPQSGIFYIQNYDW